MSNKEEPLGEYMTGNRILNVTSEQEKEIIHILLDSSLYRDMPASDKQELLRYLVTSYFDPLHGENGPVHSRTIQFVPEM